MFLLFFLVLFSFNQLRPVCLIVSVWFLYPWASLPLYVCLFLPPPFFLVVMADTQPSTSRAAAAARTFPDMDGVNIADVDLDPVVEPVGEAAQGQAGWVQVISRRRAGGCGRCDAP